jgi:hypothetical protein
MPRNINPGPREVSCRRIWKSCKRGERTMHNNPRKCDLAIVRLLDLPGPRLRVGHSECLLTNRSTVSCEKEPVPRFSTRASVFCLVVRRFNGPWLWSQKRCCLLRRMVSQSPPSDSRSLHRLQNPRLRQTWLLHKQSVRSDPR